MEIPELRLKCIDASKFYYGYLEQNNGGIEEIQISHKNEINPENSTWELRIRRKLYNPDCIKIYNSRYNEFYDLEHFSVREYDADKRLLIIQLTTTIDTIKKTNFSATPEHNLTIISDLKFLIKNVEDWYTDNGHKICFNDEANINGNLDECVSCQLTLNDNQRNAFKNILSHKYNYVWGPPGTGKTHYVLSATVLHYLNENNPKIGIFAPTNNALEQVLAAILKHIDKEKRKTVLRIGSPSSSYVNEYPETCEIQGLERRVNEIGSQIEIIKNVIEYRRGKFAFNSVFAIQKDIQKITDLNTQLNILLVSRSQKENELAALTKESKSLTSQLKRVFNIGTVNYQDLIGNKENELAEIKKQIDLLNPEVNPCFLRIANVDTRSDKIKEIIQTINIQNYSVVVEQLDYKAKEIDDYLNVNAALAQTYSNLDDTALNALLMQREKEYENLKASRIEERIKDCSIIGMTLDAYIGRFSNAQINFSSIFLDEAAYAPLIKALTLFSNNCGITFLGDHKQLPPVCEFDSVNTIPGLYRLLWSKPSVFSETILSYDEEDCLNMAENTDCPDFKYIKKTILIESHRFGQNLAKLLDELVYKVGYKSALSDERSLDLCFINASNPNIADGRRNENECEKIRNILSNDIDGDHCILTPYLRQVSVLQGGLQMAGQEERILTVHKSQGREWDTVILSVVDGSTITPWFTNSLDPISQGLYILNTAISRARKRLIIVCDANHWFTRQDAERQLISNLINISRKMGN